MQLFPLQEYSPTDWSGLTTENHLYSIFAIDPVQTDNLITMIHQINNGMDLDSFLKKFGVKYYDSDEDFRWFLQGNSRKNIPLIRAEINGTTVAASDQTGIAGSRFTLVFGEAHFSDTDLIVGEKNERYPIRVLDNPQFVGSEVHYECELFTNDPDLFIPYEELASGKRFSKEWNPVERYFSMKGGTVNYTSPFSMINSFSQVRMEDTRPGNMVARPVAFTWKGLNGESFTTWLQYADYELETQFQESISRLLMFSTSNKRSDNTYFQKGKSGVEIKQGAGIKQQMDSSNVTFYNNFDIKWMTELMLDMSVNKLTKDQREFVLRTGEWGMYQFSEALEDYTALYTPLQVEERVYSGPNNVLGYKGQFLEFMGPQGIRVSLSHEPMNDDPVRNKILHDEGGLAESRVYYVLDIGTSNGSPNIQKCALRNSMVKAVVPGIRSNPKSPDLKGGYALAAHPGDGWYITLMDACGAKVTDPTRTASFRPTSLADVGVVY